MRVFLPGATGVIGRQLLPLLVENGLAEREATHKAFPGAEMIVVKDAGHFLSLDAPHAVVRFIRGFCLPHGKILERS